MDDKEIIEKALEYAKGEEVQNTQVADVFEFAFDCYVDGASMVKAELSELQERYNKMDKISDIQDKMLECLTDYINKTNKTFFADSKEPTHGSIFKLLNYDLERLKAGLKEQ